MSKPEDISETEIAADKLRGFVGEIEASDERIASENSHKSDIYKKAKKDGYNVKALRKVIAARRMDDVDRSRLDADFDLYMMHLEGVAHAHVEIIEQFDAETGEIIESADTLRRDRESPPTLATAEPSSISPDGSANQSQAALQSDRAPFFAGVEGDVNRQPISPNADDTVALPSVSGPADDLASIPRQAGHPSVIQFKQAGPIRPYCLKQGTGQPCGGVGRQHCYACEKAHATGGVKIEHHGQIA